MRAIGRAAATAILAALLGAAAAALLYAWRAPVSIAFDRDPPPNVTGIYPPELDRDSGLRFAWTSANATLRLPGLDRGVPWTLDVRVRGGRAVSAENPDLTVTADGATLATVHSTTDFADVPVPIPARPGRRGIVIGLVSSRTFVPGPGDTRPLGVMLDRLALAPNGIVLVPDAALAATALSAAAMGAAIALLGMTAGSAIGGAVLLSIGTAAVVTRGGAPFTDYPSIVIRLGCWIGLGLAVAAAAVHRWRNLPLRNTARFAAAFSAAALFLKLLVLLHPDMPVGDAMSHAHRFREVVAGRLSFPAVAAGRSAWPQAPGLYVFAAPFAHLAGGGAGDIALLRIVATSVDAAMGLLLYWTVARHWGNRLAAAVAVAIYHLMPLNFGVLTAGNLANAFAQSIAIGALAMMSAPALTVHPIALGTLLALVLSAAFLSHTGTFAIVFVAAIATAGLFAARGGRDLRGAARIIAAAALAAALLSVAACYAPFMEAARAAAARIGHATVAAAADAGWRAAGLRARLVPYSLGLSVGAPALLFAFLGAVELARRPAAADRLALVLAGWGTSCGTFLVLGILTPVDLGHYRAALPVTAVAAGYGAAWAWEGAWPPHRTLWRVTAAVLLAGAISTGFHHWWSVLG